jgi:hypothetical protein
MIRSFLWIVIGIVVGATGGLYWSSVSTPVVKQLSTADQTLLASCQATVAKQERTIVSLTQSVAADTAECVVPTPALTSNEVQTHNTMDNEAQRSQAIAWRISSIEKFVPLTDEQKERLESKYAEERQALVEERESEAESLDDILGAESAATYRNQVKAAFERVQNEELEKEVLWTSRKLSLNEDQERALQAAFADVEMALKGEFRALIAAAQTPAERVTLMIQENKKRRQLRAELVKDSLSPEQYQAFLALEAQSASADMEVFHEPS